LLVCPWCGDGFTVESFDDSAADGDVGEGLLRCRCDRLFPIVNGIPRILEDAFKLFPDFVNRHRARLPPLPEVRVLKTREAEAIRRTRESFGYQWTEFSEMAIDFRENFLNYIAPLDESFFPGKVGLDMGCGFGRHIYNAAKFGAEMIGVDLSDAIESTRANTKHLPNVHLVQANVYRLPIRAGVLDFAYSIGVLHHLPDPEEGFRCLLPLVKPRGSVFIWVYSKSRSKLNACLEAARAVAAACAEGHFARCGAGRLRRLRRAVQTRRRSPWHRRRGPAPAAQALAVVCGVPVSGRVCGLVRSAGRADPLLLQPAGYGGLARPCPAHAAEDFAHRAVRMARLR
jgi:SAM-dependent methyltransferase/uncharacterized protein YbaR (Trm112 family)